MVKNFKTAIKICATGFNLKTQLKGGIMKTMELTEIQNAWNNIAEGYDAFVTPTHDWELPKKVFNQVGITSGMKFLDVASGSGALSIPAAQLGANVTAVDISADMIRLLNKRARSEGLTNVEGKVMDGHALEFEDNTFDITGSQFGVMLFPDLPKGLQEMVRVTKKGGYVFVVAYASPKKVEFLTYFLHALQIVVPGFKGIPLDPAPLPFQVADPKVLRQRMEEAGLKEIKIEQDIEELEFNSGKGMWNWVTNSNPIAVGLIKDLSETQKIEVQQALDDMLKERHQNNNAAVITAEVNIAIGKK